MNINKSLAFIILMINIIIISTVNANPYSTNLYSFQVSSSNNITGNLTNFTELLDTPNSYIGAGGDCVAVNSGEDSLEFINCSNGSEGSNTTVYEGTNISVQSNSTGYIINLDESSVFSWLSNLFYPLNSNPSDYINQTYGNATYILQSDEGNLNVNSSDYWDNLDSYNSTELEEQTGGILGISKTWLENFILPFITWDNLLNKPTNINDTTQITLDSRSLTSGTYLNLGGIVTGATLGYVADCNGSITSATYSTQISSMVGGFGNWSFTPRINGVAQTDLQWLKNFTAGTYSQERYADYGVATYELGDIISAYANEVDGAVTVANIHTILRLACHDE